MADIFVSYARSDRARVAPLVAALEAEGWTVWWDPEITTGQEFDRRISDELKRASAVLVVWTPRSVESRWVRGEARDGAERGLLVPVRFEKAELPIDVRALHTTDLDDWDGSPQAPKVQEVLRALRATVERHRTLLPVAALATSSPSSSGPAASAGKANRIAVCVLPFANMSGDAEQEYFSDGITEDIITDLSKVSALSVTSRNSAFVFKGKHVEVPKVARELNVTHILEGSVRKAGGRVRITAQLVEATKNEHLWAERYDRDLQDIFALQDEISKAIVSALQLKLLPAEKRAIEWRGTDNVEAYNLYLMGRQMYLAGNEGDARRADAIVRVCRRATELDPNYARAWALLAMGESLARFAAGTGRDGGMAAAERALTLDNDLAEAHAVKATVLAGEGRHDEASDEISTALRLDPESAEVNRAAGYLSYRLNHLDEAIRFWEKATAVMETDINSPAMLLSCYRAIGNLDSLGRTARLVLDRCEKVLRQDPNNGLVLGCSAYALAALGDVERAKDRMTRALLVDPDNLNMRYNFACALVIHLPDYEAALDLLEPFFENTALGFLNHAKVDPDFKAIREHPRFKAMVEMAEARLARG
jgi:adenylate cyclase